MISERIRQARQSKALTIKQLTLMCQCNKNTISDEERGLTEPFSNMLCKIADATDTSIDWLLERSDEMENTRKTTGDASERLKLAISESKMSRREIIEKAGISNTVLYCFLRGKAMRCVNLLAITDTLGISADWLFGRSDNMYLS